MLFSLIAIPVKNSLEAGKPEFTDTKKVKTPKEIYGMSPYEMACKIIKRFDIYVPYSHVDGLLPDGSVRYSYAYGLKADSLNQYISKEKANIEFKEYMDKRLAYDISSINHIRNTHPVIFAVLCDFAYNRGSIPEDFLYDIQSESWDDLCSKIKMYVYSTKKEKVSSLVRRREFCVDLIKNRKNPEYIKKRLNKL